MKPRHLLAAAVLLAGGLTAGAARAETGYANASIYLHAGPGRDFPLIAHVLPGDRLEVRGCVSGYAWCDVSASGNRGWIAGKFLDTVYNDRHVPVAEYGPQLRLPTVGFEQKSYWEANYSNYPFFTARHWWPFAPRAETPAEVRDYRYNDVEE